MNTLALYLFYTQVLSCYVWLFLSGSRTKVSTACRLAFYYMWIHLHSWGSLLCCFKLLSKSRELHAHIAEIAEVAIHCLFRCWIHTSLFCKHLLPVQTRHTSECYFCSVASTAHRTKLKVIVTKISWPEINRAIPFHVPLDILIYPLRNCITSSAWNIRLPVRWTRLWSACLFSDWNFLDSLQPFSSENVSDLLWFGAVKSCYAMEHSPCHFCVSHFSAFLWSTCVGYPHSWDLLCSMYFDAHMVLSPCTEYEKLPSVFDNCLNSDI